MKEKISRLNDLSDSLYEANALLEFLISCVDACKELNEHATDGLHFMLSRIQNLIEAGVKDVEEVNK